MTHSNPRLLLFLGSAAFVLCEQLSKEVVSLPLFKDSSYTVFFILSFKQRTLPLSQHPLFTNFSLALASLHSQDFFFFKEQTVLHLYILISPFYSC